MCVTMSPGFIRSRSTGSGDAVCPMCAITGSPKEEATSCARREDFHVVGGDPPRQPHLDAGDDIPVARDGIRGRIDIGQAEVHRVAVGEDAGPPDVDQHGGRLRRRTHDGRHLVDLVGTPRSRVDPARHASGEAHPRTLQVPGIVRMDVEEPRNDEPPRRVDDLRRIAGDPLPHGRDPSTGDRHIADNVQTERGIDDAAAPDEEVVLGGAESPAAGERHDTRGRRADEPAPVHPEVSRRTASVPGRERTGAGSGHRRLGSRVCAISHDMRGQRRTHTAVRAGPPRVASRAEVRAGR